jgi:DNA-binding beta-propeller fold protein YncE
VPPNRSQLELLKTALVITAALALASLPSACTKKLPPPKPYLAFVANRESNTVAVVNMATFRLVRSIAVPPEPVDLAARPGSHDLYVLSESGDVSVIADPSMQLTESMPIGTGAANLALAPDGSRAAASDAAGEVAIIDCARGAVSARLKTGGDIGGLIFTPDSKILIAADRKRERLVFVDAPTAKVLGEVSVGKQPGPMAVLPDGNKLFVADTGEAKISAIDVASRQILSHLELASEPIGLALKPDGGELLVFSRDSGSLTIIDTFHDDVEEDRPMSIGKNPVAAVPTRDSTKLYVLNGSPDGGYVQAIDVQNRAPLCATDVGSDPTAIALTPDERYLAVTASSSLAVLATSPLNPKPKVPGTPLPLITDVAVGAKPVAVSIPGWTQ